MIKKESNSIIFIEYIKLRTMEMIETEINNRVNEYYIIIFRLREALLGTKLSFHHVDRN